MRIKGFSQGQASDINPPTVQLKGTKQLYSMIGFKTMYAHVCIIPILYYTIFHHILSGKNIL